MLGVSTSIYLYLVVCFILVNSFKLNRYQIQFIILGQAIWRKCQDVGLATAYVTNATVRVFIWHILAMAFMPLEDHEGALQVFFNYDLILILVAGLIT